MVNSKLINIIKTFSPAEIRQFEKFLSSTYHKAEKNCMPFFIEVKKFYPHFTGSRFTYEYIYSRLYPGRAYNKQVMWNLGSAIEKSAEKFLVQTALQKNPFREKALLLGELKERKLAINFKAALAGLEKYAVDEKLDYFYFENNSTVEGSRIDYYYLIDKVKDMADAKLKDYEYHLLMYLRHIAGGVNDMNILERNFNIKYRTNIPLEFIKCSDLEKLCSYANRQNYKYGFLIEIYYHSIQMVLHPSEASHFTAMRELFVKHSSKFSVNEKRNMMFWLLNYCRQPLRAKEIDYIRVDFELNQFRLNEGLVFYPENQISKGLFNNIKNSALNAGEVKWAEDFIRKYSLNLSADVKHDTVAFAKAQIYFLKNEYERVLDCLNKTVFNEPGDKIASKILTAQTLFELTEFESLLNHIDTSLHFLSKNEAFTSKQISFYGSFFKILKRTVRLIFKNNKTNTDELIVDLKQTETVSKSWLMEKINNIPI